MRKKVLTIVVLLGFFAVLTPLSYSAPRKDAKLTFSILIKKPIGWMSSLYDMVSDYFIKQAGSSGKTLIPDDSAIRVKPLGGLPSPRPSGRD